MQAGKWYAMAMDDVVRSLEVDLQQGIEEREAERRLQQLGPNQLQEKKKVSPVKLFVDQFRDVMVLVLMAAAVVSGLLGEKADTITILAIVVLNAVLGFIQEFRAERSLEALQQLTAPEATVLRGGEELRIAAAKLVPGDVVLLNAGDRVPADLRLFHAVSLECEESTLTGESCPVAKDPTQLATPGASLGDRAAMAYMGTLVTRGRGQGVVVATGMATEMGMIAGMIQQVEAEQTPLQRRLNQLGRWLVLACLVLTAVVVVTGIWRGEAVYQMFLAGISLAVAAIPEGLPAIVTVALALGVQRMIRRQAIVRRLPAVETLGCATMICSDKTGTLTQNQMTVRKVWCDGMWLEVTGEGYQPQGTFKAGGQHIDPQQMPSLKLLLRAAALCNNATINTIAAGQNHRQRVKGDREADIVLQGDPTEGALVVMAAKAGINRQDVEKNSQRQAEFPFDSTRKRMAVVYGSGEQVVTYVKGAPDVILPRCMGIWMQGWLQPMTTQLRLQLAAANETMGGQALRVLALAWRKLPAGIDLQEAVVEQDLIFLGLAGMQDPPRPAAIRAIYKCRQAGIKVAMVTGDHPVTARAVAAELGLSAGADQVMTGTQLDQLDETQLVKLVRQVTIFARVSPQHKLRIVKALKAQGEVVAMTGDGVNDAPAVKEADIGVAMGINGTDVTKEAAGMILADDNFATIVAAVEEGRGIYDNIRKFIRYLLSCNVGEVLTMFLAALLGFPLPLLPIQILWVNLVTDGLPAMALGVDNPDPDLMHRPPRHPRESVFAHGLAWKIAGRGVQIGLSSLGLFVAGWVLYSDLAMARTMAFTTLVFCQLFHVFECKSERYSPFEVGFFSNQFLVMAVLVSVCMQLAVLYLPSLQVVFKTVPLDWFQWFLILVVSGWRTGLAGLKYWWWPNARRGAYLNY